MDSQSPPPKPRGVGRVLKILICFLFGHEIVVKAATGQQFDTIDRLTGESTKGNYYVWRRMEFCVRCGKTAQTQGGGK